MRGIKLRKSFKFSKYNAGVSPVIGVILTVAICVVLASVAYVWISSLASDVGKDVVEPLKVTPELNIDRSNDELALKIIIGRNINWDNYRVMLNGSEVKTTPGLMSLEGETVYFNYNGKPMIPGNGYDLDIIEIRSKTVVYSKTIFADSYPAEVTGIWGYVTSEIDGLPLLDAVVSLHKYDEVVNFTEVDSWGIYTFEPEVGEYAIECKVNFSLEGEYNDHTGMVTITNYQSLQYDIIMKLVVPESSTLQGNVYDNFTKEPIINADVRITDHDILSKNNITNETGHYYFKLQPLNITIVCMENGYQLFKKEISISSNESKIYDIYLDRVPPQTGIINGFVYDNKTGDPLSGVRVYTESPYLTNYTLTDENGSFQINVVPGNVTIFVNYVYYIYWEKSAIIQHEENYLVYIYLDLMKGR